VYRKWISSAGNCAAAARRVLSGGAVLLCASIATLALGASEPADELLRRADDVKTSNPVEFAALMKQIEERQPGLSASQRQFLDYLRAWQGAFRGDYQNAIPKLREIIRDAESVTLKFRATATVANALAVATQYDEAFAQLTQLLVLLPEVHDPAARQQGLAVIAYLYNQVGEYELGLSYADKLAAEDTSGAGVCRSGYLRLEALYKSGKLSDDLVDSNQTLDTCIKLGDSLRANAIRTFKARWYLDHGRAAEMIVLLNAHYDEARQTRYARLISEYDSLLARAHMHRRDTALARQFALRALAADAQSQNQYTEPLVASYRLLYTLARDQGDTRSALTYHEKFAAADKGYLDDVSARQLAYERAKHEAAANRLEIDGLNKQNEVLQLQQALGKKAVETSRLYILLLITIVAFIALWAYRTKLSQLHFMKLSRVDGLTGIANRPHFIDEAERTLENARRQHQEVCVVLCDLDHFKTINDRYGHPTGDFVLKQSVAACRTHLRTTDLFGRFGGEEFCILLPGCSLADARQRCEQLRGAIAALPAQAGSMVPNVSASFGVASTGSSGYELRQLLAHADAALYRAKNAGRNCVVLYEAMPALKTG
jgi:diguanylate cyclase (GGDEF)-like protein